MTDAGRHPRIKLLTLAQIEQVGGYVGNFKVRVRQRPRFVREKECTACGDCAKVCPQTAPNEFEIGLATRKAIYSPFPQAVPSAYLVDPATCLGQDPLVCGKCIKACKKQCVDFDLREEVHEFEVGTMTFTLTGTSPSRFSLRVGVTVTVSKRPASLSTTSTSRADTGCDHSANPPARTTSVTSPLGIEPIANLPSGPESVCCSTPLAPITRTEAPETTPPASSLIVPDRPDWAA